MAKILEFQMKFIFPILLLLFTFSFAPAQQTGSVCVEKFKSSTQSNIGNPNFGVPSGNKIQIDGKIAFRSSENAKIGGLSLKKKHLIKIYSDKKLVHSFKFAFSEFDRPKLCLFLNDFYGTWQLWEANRTKSCGCK